VDKSPYFTIQHIRSHQDEKLPENIGNDQADAIANAYRAEGEHVDPIPYFTLAEEKIIFQYHGNNIQGDVREVMKKIEQETMVEVWTKRTKVQSLWFQKHPTQILKQAKRVWQSAILKGEGSAWVYFIFAVCQWLPTNYSLYRKIQSDRSRTSCVLCLSNTAETVDHLLVCPALASEAKHLRDSTARVLFECKFPFVSMIMQNSNARIVDNFMIASKDLPSKNRSGDTIGRLAWDFLSANEHEQFIGVRHFLEHTTRVLNQQASCVPLTNDLLAILVHELHLWVEGNTDALLLQIGRCVVWSQRCVTAGACWKKYLFKFIQFSFRTY